MEDGQNTRKAIPNTRLRTAREMRGWSQRELAHRLEISELTVGRWERGERTPQLLFRARLCELFGMSAQELGLSEEVLLKSEKREEPSPFVEEVSLPSTTRVLTEVVPTYTERIHRWDFARHRKQFIVGAVGLFVIMTGVLSGLLFYRPFSPPVKGAAATPSHPNAAPIAAWTSYGRSIINPALNPVLDDPLTKPNPHYYWYMDKDCNYIGGHYHEYSDHINYCLNAEQTFKNFEYHIIVTITKGAQAGTVFRADGNNHLYYFYIDIYGNYGLYIVNHLITTRELIRRTGSPAIKRGVGQPNQLGIIALDGTIILYINGHYINQTRDTTFSEGEIGSCVGDYNDFYAGPFNATYQDAKIWNLES